MESKMVQTCHGQTVTILSHQTIFPVLLFCHGFMLANTCYTDLLKHIASHGYIVVAPKFYGFLPISIPDEVQKAAQVTEWLSPSVLPEKVNPDIDNLALSGHSRGGKIAFALALGKTDQKSHKTKTSVKDNPTPLKFKAIIGVDPVAGGSVSNRPQPEILKYIPRSFDMSIPVAVIGTENGNQPLGIFPVFEFLPLNIPPCAPNGVNHSEFFNESKPPVSYFLAKDYGHCDMLDDKLDDWMTNLASHMIKSGKGSKELMRKGVGGIVVAFLKFYLGGDEKDFDAIVGDPSIAPITLDPVIYVKE
ncbi:hypothetical protein BUALT_Bualt13G0033200 [Buddleja alternifolia]|uniref:Chlorophyllase n=1 Tax=Buddleja alternifolia TaxID=168488 RepID=A0AAV6WR45_9LAMI|nr:hypothetical protein BUALT_Bualt13G0033200 [Buddleja alternifolia]